MELLESAERVSMQADSPIRLSGECYEKNNYPYHLQCVQAFSLQEHPVRVMYCHWFLQQCGTNPNFSAFAILIDETQLRRDRIQNFHDQRLWVDVILPLHCQQWFSINIWAIICGNNLFRPHVLPNRLTGQNYKAFLENNMPDFFADVLLIIP
jgi:hypothetical protein